MQAVIGMSPFLLAVLVLMLMMLMIMMMMVCQTEKSQEDGHESIRLIQETPNLASFTLLAKLGFEPKDQLNFFMGRCAASWPEPKLDLVIREMTFNDINACAALHRFLCPIMLPSFSIFIINRMIDVCIHPSNQPTNHRQASGGRGPRDGAVQLLASSVGHVQ